MNTPLQPLHEQVIVIGSTMPRCRCTGRITELSIADMRRQMDVNYQGQVYGSRVAVRHLRQRGGALINVASALADRAIPLQGNYCAAKHALKAFTDALRMYLGVEPQPVPPAYVPEVVSEVILHAAQRPVRELIAGERLGIQLNGGGGT